MNPADPGEDMKREYWIIACHGRVDDAGAKENLVAVDLLEGSVGRAQRAS